MPRARLDAGDGKTSEWKSKALRAYQRRTKAADALIASTYLAGTNTRRVRRALAALFGGAVGKDTVSRVWRKVKSDWDAWNARSLADEPIVRLILDGTVVRVRLDRKATSISLLVVIGVREDGQKVLLAVKNMGGETPRPGARCSTISSRGLAPPGVPDRRRRTGARQGDRRGLGRRAGSALHGSQAPEPAGARARAPARGDHRRLHRHDLRRDARGDRRSPQGLHPQVAAPASCRRRQPGGGRRRLFTFTRLPPSQWRSARTTNAIERLHEEFKRRIKTQTVLPSADTAAMLFWALLASGQIIMRKVDGWQTLATKPVDQPIDLAA